MGDVQLESPFPDYAIPRVWGWAQEFRHRVADDFGPKTLAEFVTNWEEQEGRKTWAVWRDGELGGAITATWLSPMLADAHFVFRREFWGHQTTLVALRIAFGELYQSGAEKITAKTFRDNRAILAVMAALGATKEGVLHRHTKRAGKAADVVLIGIQKERFNHGGIVVGG